MQAIHFDSIRDVELCLAQMGSNFCILTEKDHDARTALIVAAMYGHGNCVRLLLLPKSDPLAKDRHGGSASEIAKQGGYHDLTQMIVAYVLAKTEAVAIADHISHEPRRKVSARRM